MNLLSKLLTGVVFVFTLLSCGGGGSKNDLPAPQLTGLLDTACNGTGKVFFSPAISSRTDTAIDAYGLVDGSTVFFGNIAQPENMQPVVEGGYWSSRKLKPDCSIDTAYGNNGLISTSFSRPLESGAQMLRSMIRLDDGSSYVFGESSQEAPGEIPLKGFYPGFITFTKLLSTGVIDPSYGVKIQEVKTTTTQDTFAPDKMKVQATKLLSDGKILVLSQAEKLFQDVFTIMRFNADGSLDNTFNQTGKFIFFEVFSANFSLHKLDSIEVQTDGKILLGGSFTTGNSTPYYVPGVMRLNPDLTLDTTFGVNGVAGLREGGLDFPTKIAVLADGKILLFGTGFVNEPATGYQVMTATRLLSDGKIDASFGIGGTTRVDVDNGKFAPQSANLNILRSAIVLPDGKIIMAGDSYNLNAAAGNPESFRHIGLVRLTSSGALDPSFATKGIFSGLETANAATEIVSSVRLMADGKLAVTATRSIDQITSGWVFYRFTN
jgi:uncharacterized delta-60 repeat protein